MKMTKQTKTLIGVGVLGVVAYLIWKQNQDKKNFTRNRTTRIGSRAQLSNLSDIRSQVRAGSSETDGLQGMMGGGFIIIDNCARGYTAQGGAGYICCDPRYSAPKSADVECTGGKPGGKAVSLATSFDAF
jgi:hypothetical protein